MLKKITYFVFLLIIFFGIIPQIIFAENTSQFIPGQLIVKYKQGKKGILKERLSSIIQSERSLVKPQTKSKNNLLDQYTVIQIPVGKENEIINKIRQDVDVENVEFDYIRRTYTIPNDPLYNQQWQYQTQYLDMQNVWDMQGDDNAVMAVIDTGIDINHEDIQGKLWVNPGEIAGDGIDNDGNGYIDDINGVNIALPSSSISDDYGHGTSVASAALASSNNGKGITGVTWRGKIMVIKANDPGTGGLKGSDIANALIYASSFPEVKVINMSLEELK